MVEAWNLYATISTQWRTAPMGGFVGLDYMAVFAVLDLYGINVYRKRVIFRRIQAIESEVLKIQSERQKMEESKR